ncbi:tRNA (guanine-N(7)-)-methyltransferase (tRNA(m7G46)-methyltransferase) [Elasticomyces elasticus]|nr:tRNA (guanine-N(7)-)-methyltransferase (tRNA(m7G46)-methyltransferase) [Elasticomyces elasticus]
MALSYRSVVVAGVVAFIAWGYATNWIPALRWIPHAFITGTVCTILGFLYLLVSTARHDVYHSSGHDRPPPPVAAFALPKSWLQEKTALNLRNRYIKTPIYPKSKAVSVSLDGLFELILRDFITVWYGNISKRPLFQNEVDRAIRSSAKSICDRLSKVDVVEAAVLRIVPALTSHVRDFGEAERAVRGKTLSRGVTESEELDTVIAGKYRDGRLHKAASLAYADSSHPQQAYLRALVEKVLPLVLPQNMQSSPSVMILIKDIVSWAVLLPTVRLLADPDTWNQAMEGYTRTVLRDRKTVRKLRAALDEHAPPSPRTSRPAQFPHLRPADDERRFERFIRAVKHCNTLSEARRFRSEIVSQMRRDTSASDSDVIYLRRLETAKRILDQRITLMSANGAARPKSDVKPTESHVRFSRTHQEATLEDVLYNASGLSYFMEYMDRLKLMRLVQFWVVVDGFRDPLVEETDEVASGMPGKPAWTESDRADIAQISEAYLDKKEIGALDSDREAVRLFLKAGSNASSAQYYQARQAILQCQRSVFAVMKEQHYPSFRKTDLFYKWLATEESKTALRPAQEFSPSATLARRAVADSPTRLHGRAADIPRFKESEPSLRRAAASSTDIRAKTKPSDASTAFRRSFDDIGDRPALFDDDVEDERMVQSVPSLRTVTVDQEAPDNHADTTGPQVVEAMQTALTDIMDEDLEKDSTFFELTMHSGAGTESPQSATEVARPTLMTQNSEKGKPSIASLGLIGAPSGRGVFDDDLFGDEEKFAEDEREGSDVHEATDDEDVHEAAPGDLGLKEAIDALGMDIERLAAQESILDSLTKKAELTNNAAELRILRKSKASLQREMHRKELQKQQYIIQESDNSLYGRAAVAIKSIMVGKEQDGYEYAIYVIEVRKQAGDQIPAASWTVARRYSEFHTLNKRLRARFPSIRSIEFPGRQALFTLQKDFLQKRRVMLERYLRALLLIPAVCRSRELRAFLSQHTIAAKTKPNGHIDARDFVTRIYESVSDGMEEFLGNVPVLDQLTLAGQNLISAATSQVNDTPLDRASDAVQDANAAARAEAEMRAFENRELEPFVKPICDLFLESFELNSGNNWLRGRAVVVVLHQLLGGTIERKVRETAKSLLQDTAIAGYIDLVRNTMWPGGKLRQSPAPRSDADKAQSRKEASLLLAILIPELAGSVVGRANAQAASRRLFATLNNQRLNTHLVFTLLDEVVQVLFPEVGIR